MGKPRVVITGTGAVCAAGRAPEAILEAVRAGRSAIAPIRQWNASTWPRQVAGEIPEFNARELVEDRKLHKLIRRTDLFGLYAASKAIEAAGIAARRDAIDAAEALRNGEADRAIAVGHDAPIEPQMVLYYHDVGLLAKETIRPFDARRDGSLFGEGAAALALETEASARERDAAVLGEILGGRSATDASRLLAIRDDGDGLARAIELALRDAGIRPTDVGMIAAHGNGTPQSDASEAAAIRRVFGDAAPPATAFKWAFGHLIAAAGILDAVLALHALRERSVPAVATYAVAANACKGARVSAEAQAPRGDIALILCRGFASTNAALLLRAAR